MTELKKTLCNRDCPDACAIVATVENGRVVRLGGDPDHPSRAASCASAPTTSCPRSTRPTA